MSPITNAFKQLGNSNGSTLGNIGRAAFGFTLPGMLYNGAKGFFGAGNQLMGAVGQGAQAASRGIARGAGAAARNMAPVASAAAAFTPAGMAYNAYNNYNNTRNRLNGNQMAQPNQANQQVQNAANNMVGAQPQAANTATPQVSNAGAGTMR